jgi:cytochrome c-type biogenesis protein CcmH/NrfG
LKLNLDYYPNSAPTYAQLGQQQLAAGDTAAAVAALQKALELQPNNPQVQGLLQRLRRP